MKEIYNLEYKNEHIDFDIRNINKKNALYPMISYQDDVFTGNDYSCLYKIIILVYTLISVLYKFILLVVIRPPSP